MIDWNLAVVIIPYIIGLAVPIGVSTYAFRHSQVNGAHQYGWYVLTRTVWNLGLLFEVLSPTSRGKTFWLFVEALSIPFILVSLSSFFITYTESRPRKFGLAWGALILPPILFLFLILTNGWHELIFRNPYFDPNNPISLLHVEFTPVTWLILIYSSFLMLVFFGVLIGKFIRAHSIYRSQVFTIMLGMATDILGVWLAVALNRRELIPPAAVVGNLIVAWGLFRFRLFDLRPIARENLFESTADLVVVLDAQNRIVDANASALREFNLTSKQIIGQPAASFFSSDWKEFREPVEGNWEYYIRRNDKYFHFDVHTMLIHDYRGQPQGRIFVARNITAYAELQWQMRELNEQLKNLNADLEDRVRKRTNELAEAYDTTLQGWARALELRDKETEGHSQRVTETTLKLARALDIASTELDDIRRGALLHDIGKMAIPDEILRKAGPLTTEEREVITQHPVIAYHLLSPIKFLEKALEIPYCHHEKWDGTGYPRGLKGEAIPLSARIFAVADVWDAIRSDRVYRKAWPKSKAKSYLKKQASSYFDPHVVNVFLDLVAHNRI